MADIDIAPVRVELAQRILQNEATIPGWVFRRAAEDAVDDAPDFGIRRPPHHLSTRIAVARGGN